MKSLLSFFNLVSLLLWSIFKGNNSANSLEKFKTYIAHNYPDVSHVSTETVATWLSENQDLIILDIRQSQEFDVSHLQAAINIPPDTLIEEVVATRLKDIDNNHLIVVYCSIGIRSSKFAQKLAKVGFTNIHNVNGSIFAWANENRPVYRGNNLTYKVHPYDNKWGQLLDPQYRI